MTLICIEGPDGVGKDTAATAIADYLRAEIVHFPNDNAFTGPMIRSYLRREWSIRNHLPGDGHIYAETEKKIGALTFQALQIANKMELMPRLRDAKVNGRPLVLVRYWPSAWVYGQLDGLPAEWLERVHRCMVRPDLNILLDAPAEVCLERQAARDGAKRERYEGDLERQQKIVNLYRELWANPFPYVDCEWGSVDATMPIDAVVEACMRMIS